MRSSVTPYPVDRYLVESRNTIDMVNIINDDIWNPEPALRPEDEIILRKLHDMLQSTADDLKLLSGELSKYHEPGVQVKTLPMPLDEEFNEKIHIEEVVNAKFYGNKIIENSQRSSNTTNIDIIKDFLQSVNNKNSRKKAINGSVQTNDLSKLKKHPVKKKLQLSRTNIIEINEKSGDRKQKDNDVQPSIPTRNRRVPTVAYNELSYEYVKPNIKKPPRKVLQIQEMPSINIRSELKRQNVLQLDILPDSTENHTQKSVQNNALVIEMQHESPQLKQNDVNSIKFGECQYINVATNRGPAMRKVSTMSTYESSESTPNNVSSDSQHRLQKQTHKNSLIRKSPKLEQQVLRNTRKNNSSKKDANQPQAYLDEWKKKLNAVYGRTITKSYDIKKMKVSPKKSSKKASLNVKAKEKNDENQLKHDLNNVDYIPYTKLTLGGVNVRDIEREISNIPNKNDIVLSPILDKILSSRENSFHYDSPKRDCQNKGSKILTTSDENLLHEVLDIEKKVTNTITPNQRNDKNENDLKDATKHLDSYADDFEEEKSDVSDSKPTQSETSKSSQYLPSDYSCQEENDMPDDATSGKVVKNVRNENDCNLTFTKVPNLSFKSSVDIFEFIHSVDTQETGTQSNTSNKITPKGTQTSPRNDKGNLQPIHNDLWPSIDPRGEVEKMFKLEKEFIQKLIIDEYGDLLEKNINKPSTSGKTENENNERNIAASQKITQTSPAHVKSVMTSPTRTKTRTTSPFTLSGNVDQQTSPVFVVTNEDDLKKVEIDNDGVLGISANLSSPRFSLRLPQTSREVLSKFEANRNDNQRRKYDNLRKNVFSSSSSVDADYSSSDISSLGEINKKFKKLVKSRISNISEISSSSSQSKYSSNSSGAIIPLRSDGETSTGQFNRKKATKHSRSEGEISLGQLRYL